MLLALGFNFMLNPLTYIFKVTLSSHGRAVETTVLTVLAGVFKDALTF